MSARLSHYVDFYTLLALEHAANQLDAFSHSANRLRESIAEYKEEFIPQFANAIFDYSVLASLGECSYYSGHRCRGYTLTNVPENHMDCDVDIALSAMYTVFYRGRWQGAFGGNAWGEIVETQINYCSGKWDAITYLDHCADLEHNSGNYFDKHSPKMYIDFYDNLHRFLDWKRDNDIIRDMPETGMYNQYLSYKMISLLNRYYVISGLNLFIVDGVDCKRDRIEYSPIVWGNAIPYAKKDDGVHRSSSHHYSSSHEDRNEDRTRYYACAGCGNVFRRQHLNYFNGEHYCDDCYNENFTTCSNCDGVYSIYDLFYCEVSEMDYCESCYGDIVTHCVECDAEIDTNYNDYIETDDGCYCEDCKQYVKECEDCGIEFYNDDDGLLCDDCQAFADKQANLLPDARPVVQTGQLTFLQEDSYKIGYNVQFTPHYLAVNAVITPHLIMSLWDFSHLFKQAKG